MPDNHRRTPHPITVCTTISREQDAKLQARADLQGLSRAQVLRALIAALPEPNPHPPRARRAGDV